MHGVIFSELRKYANTKVGAGAWDALLTEAGLAGKVYLATQSYPDEEVVALVGAASRVTKTPAPAILEDFGEFIAPDLIAMFRSLLRTDWKTLDVLEHTEETIHKVVRLQYADARPPYLQAERVSEHEVRIRYNSPRKLCFIAIGIAKGIAKNYGEIVKVTESRCMHRGAAECVIEVVSP